jgi:hypothetical protein
MSRMQTNDDLVEQRPGRRGRSYGSWGAALVTLVLLGACSAGSDPHSEIVVDTLDSGRIVVTNPPEASAPGQPWSLEEIVRIGAVDGAPEEMFGWIVDVVLGLDGLIYVLDAQASEVRVFDQGGRHVRTIARPGSGPGELSGPYSIWIDPDRTLWIAEERGRRYSRFRLKGEFIGTMPAPIRGGAGRGQLRVTADNLWDFASVVVRRPQPDGSTRLEGLGMGAMGFALSNGLATADTVLLGAWLPPGLTVVMGEERGVVPPPFAPYRVQDVGPDGRVWVGTGDVYELHQLRGSTDTARTLVRGGEPILLSEAHRNQLGDWLDEMRGQGLDGDRSDLPSHYPFFSRIVVADDGHVWTFRDAPAGRSRFDIFDPEGRYLGAVGTDLKAGIDGVHPHITPDHVLGVAEDELGVQSVALYRIGRESN